MGGFQETHPLTETLLVPKREVTPARTSSGFLLSRGVLFGPLRGEHRLLGFRAVVVIAAIRSGGGHRGILPT